MQRLWAGLFLLATGLAGCHSDKTINADLLYRTWQQTRQETNDGKIIPVTSHSSYILTFRQNGTILYGADGTYPICCNPVRFNRKGATLDLVDVSSITLPADVPKADCSAVDCVPLDKTWQILTLSSTQLVLKQDRGIATYQPYP